MGIYNIQIYKRWSRQGLARKVLTLPRCGEYLRKESFELWYEIKKMNRKKTDHLILPGK